MLQLARSGYPDISPDTTVEYYSNPAYPSSESPASFFGKHNYADEFKFTKIYIRTPSSNFVSDLWMDGSAPARVSLAAFAAKNQLAVSIALFALFSCLASYLAGTFAFRGGVKGTRLALVGLANFLTIIGFAAAAWAFIKPKKAEENSRLKFVAAFSALSAVFGAALLLLSGASASILSLAFLSAVYVAIVIAPQLIAAYLYFRRLKIPMASFAWPAVLAVADMVPILLAALALNAVFREGLLSNVLLLVAVVLAEGFMLELVDKRAFGKRHGYYIAALMKAAALLIGLCAAGLLWFASRGVYYY